MNKNETILNEKEECRDLLAQRFVVEHIDECFKRAKEQIACNRFKVSEKFLFGVGLKFGFSCALKTEVEELQKKVDDLLSITKFQIALIDSVHYTDVYGAVCRDVDGENWFDRREAIKEQFQQLLVQ